MPLSKVWIHAEIGGDKPSTVTLEIATKARELGETVEAFYAGDNPEGVAEELGKYGVSKVYAVDTGGTLQGVPVASAMADQINGGNAPDLVMFASTYDGRDVLAPLPVAPHTGGARRGARPRGGPRQAGADEQQRRRARGRRAAGEHRHLRRHLQRHH